MTLGGRVASILRGRVPRLAVALLVILGIGGAAHGTEMQLPNLVPKLPTQFWVVTTDHPLEVGPECSTPFSICQTSPESQEDLRFETLTANRGPFRFDLMYGPLQADNSSAALQCIRFVIDVAGVRPCAERKEVGTFVYHPAHRHWHFDSYVLPELRTFDAEGKPDMSPAGVVSSLGKVSFCLLDTDKDDDSLDGTLEAEKNRQNYPQFSQCSPPSDMNLIDDVFAPVSTGQGISPHWADGYSPSIPGQFLPIARIADGTYAFVLTVNPLGRIIETNYTDNQTWEKVHLFHDESGRRHAEAT